MTNPLWPALGAFPRVRPRRNRADAATRRLVAENRLCVDDLIWPVFVVEGEGQRQPIPSMPGVERLSLDLLIPALHEARSLGIACVALFPIVPATLKNADGDEARNPDNLMCRAVRAVKRAIPDMLILGDVALDPYTSHGHDGVMHEGRIINDLTLTILAAQAVNQARAGCAIIAPSDMMDGRVGRIRDALEASGLHETRLCSYAVKYASSFYGPFRDAVQSGGLLQGDKKTYQMDPANSDEALREAAIDLAEGADMLMVKPGLPYLDVLRRVKEAFPVPTFVYHVSGEYAMLKAASAQGWLDYDTTLMESLLAFKRAGADAILTYAALDAARLLQG
jgi:porphobilinogen synthase